MSWGNRKNQEEGSFERQELASFPVGRDEVRINQAKMPNGKITIDVRRWWLNDADEWQPGKGLNLPIEKAEQFKEALDKAFMQLTAEGIIKS